MLEYFYYLLLPRISLDKLFDPGPFYFTLTPIIPYFTLTPIIPDYICHGSMKQCQSIPGDQDRKRMVRLLIEDVTLIKAERIEVKIRYKGGQIAEHSLPLPQCAWIEKKHSPEVLAAIDQLLDEHTDGEVAEILINKGYRSGTGQIFCARRISVIRRAYKIPSRFSRLKNVVC